MKFSTATRALSFSVGSGLEVERSSSRWESDRESSSAVGSLVRVCHFESPESPDVGVIANADETPNIRDRGRLIVKEQMRYQKKRDRMAAPPPGVTAANGKANGANATAADPKTTPRTA